MLDTVPLQSRLLDHADHYARWSGLAIGIVLAQQLVTMESDDITTPSCWPSPHSACARWVAYC
ncbi:hypothetical protein [Streptomyces chartreusis]